MASSKRYCVKKAIASLAKDFEVKRMATESLLTNTNEGAMIMQAIKNIYKTFDQTALTTQNKQQSEPKRMALGQ